MPSLFDSVTKVFMSRILPFLLTHKLYTHISYLKLTYYSRNRPVYNEWPHGKCSGLVISWSRLVSWLLYTHLWRGTCTEHWVQNVDGNGLSIISSL